jgi:hypothetical protein
VAYAFEKEPSRLLVLVLTMNSTVRHFKAASRLFIEVLRQKKLKGLLPLNKAFTLPNYKEELDQKETDF